MPLTGVLPSGFPFVGQPTVCPDGSYIACIILANTRDDPANGIWLLDLKEGAARQLANNAAFQQSAADWLVPSNILPVELAWTSDSNGLLVFVTDSTYSGNWAAQNVCYLDPESGNVTRLFSYEEYEDPAQFFAPGEDGHPGVFRVPRQAILTPDSKHVISVHADDGAKQVTFMVQALSPNTLEPIVLSSILVDPRAIRYAQYSSQLTVMSKVNTALLFSRYLVSFADVELGEPRD